ncbi:MAG: thiamine-phosphate kinase, partial [Alphaproteobacteria bacterium]|nr:thiamine-phosphate kinase [Alphaproteobacteria bacterium]
AGLGDDAAWLEGRPVADGAEDERLIVTTDTLVAGVHFLVSAPARTVAQKLLAVNLSDMAAMAARPFAYTLSLALSDAGDELWLEDFTAGLAAGQSQWGVSLVGGDTVATPGPLTATATMFGWAALDKLLTRSGARSGDIVFVSGTVGDAELGLRLLNGEFETANAADRDYLIGRHYAPSPRVELAQAIVALATAGIDVSDGLVADLGHICVASGLGAVVELDAVPVSPAAARLATGADWPSTTLATGGDDYELLFTGPTGNADRIEAVAAQLGVPIARIGRMEAGQGVRLLAADGADIEVESGGYRHF